MQRKIIIQQYTQTFTHLQASRDYPQAPL